MCGAEVGRTCTLPAPDAAAPALQHIERAAIAAATQITYAPYELLLLIQASQRLVAHSLSFLRKVLHGLQC